MCAPQKLQRHSRCSRTSPDVLVPIVPAALPGRSTCATSAQGAVAQAARSTRFTGLRPTLAVPLEPLYLSWQGRWVSTGTAMLSPGWGANIAHPSVGRRFQTKSSSLATSDCQKSCLNYKVPSACVCCAERHLKISKPLTHPVMRCLAEGATTETKPAVPGGFSHLESSRSRRALLQNTPMTPRLLREGRQLRMAAVPLHFSSLHEPWGQGAPVGWGPGEV